MQAVLDGEATPAEAREVETRTASDPATNEPF
jgi:anti-sigma factor RsiW